MRTLLAAFLLTACQPANLQTTAVPTPRTAPAAEPGSPDRPRSPARPPGQVEPPAPPSRRFEHDVMMRYHMHGNLDLVRAIERLLLRGKLDPTRELARQIAEAPVTGDLTAWATEITEVRTRAAALAASPGIDEACRREAWLAGACAGCHVETRIQPEFHPSPAPPPDLDTLEARMARHRWAADRLWEGLIGADDDPWHAGLAVFAQTPIHWRAFDERKSLARRLQQLATEARQRSTTDSLDDRARIYGEMLVTCAACHTVQTP
jgi:cytochrome c553